MEERNGLVSIIMAAYNAEKTIDAAIHSVLAQTYCDWELLVVNDCSSDATMSIVEALAEKDERIRPMRNEVNSGVSKTRERGLRAARGEWIAILDSDDAWAKDKLEKQLALAREKNAELIFTGSGFMDEEGQTLDWVLRVPRTLNYHDLLKQNLISNSSALVRRELFEQHFTVGDQMHEDYAVWLGIAAEGHTAYGVDEPLLIYRVSRGSKSGNKLRSAKMQWNTYRHIGLRLISAVYYMCCYTVRGVLKHRHLR